MRQSTSSRWTSASWKGRKTDLILGRLDSPSLIYFNQTKLIFCLISYSKVENGRIQLLKHAMYL